MPENIRKEALVEAVLKALHEDQSQLSQTKFGIGHNRGPPIEDPPVFSVAEFCSRYKISRSALYTLWASGTGPRYFKIGVAVRITSESARNWCREREAATAREHADSAA